MTPSEYELLGRIVQAEELAQETIRNALKRKRATLLTGWNSDGLRLRFDVMARGYMASPAQTSRVSRGRYVIQIDPGPSVDKWRVFDLRLQRERVCLEQGLDVGYDVLYDRLVLTAADASSVETRLVRVLLDDPDTLF